MTIIEVMRLVPLRLKLSDSVPEMENIYHVRQRLAYADDIDSECDKSVLRSHLRRVKLKSVLKQNIWTEGRENELQRVSIFDRAKCNPDGFVYQAVPF